MLFLAPAPTSSACSALARGSVSACAALKAAAESDADMLDGGEAGAGKGRARELGWLSQGCREALARGSKVQRLRFAGCLVR
eukprot:3891646-Alexandrium_andersonii.AAC.1